MWQQQTLAAATRSLVSKLDEYASTVSVLPTTSKQTTHSKSSVKELDFYWCPKQYLLHYVPVCDVFLFVLLVFFFHFGALFKTLKEPCSAASQWKEWRERGYATVGTKHVCQREVFLLDIFNLKCFYVHILSPSSSVPQPLECWGRRHLTMTTYKPDRCVWSREGDRLSVCAVGQSNRTPQPTDEPITTW